MEIKLDFDISHQPDENTCGPTCLHAIYRYYGDAPPLDEVTREIPSLEHGGTFAVVLACHALRRGYSAVLYTCNLQVFDPTWFSTPGIDIRDRLRRQLEHKSDSRLQVASRGYMEFLELGGELRFEDLTAGLVRKYVKARTPILTGLSSTYLYRAPREYGPTDEPDDIRGVPMGHFVVLCGYDSGTRDVVIADPLQGNPMAQGRFYTVNIDRVLCAILLGVLTHDANLLVIRPLNKPKVSRDDHARRR